MTLKIKKAADASGKKEHKNTYFHMDATRSGKNLNAVISGVISVIDFSESKILLLTHGGRIMINGTSLAMSIFENQTVEIKGKAENIGFE